MVYQRHLNIPARTKSPDELAWPLKLALILGGYSTVAIPVLLFICYIRRRYTGRGSDEPTRWYSRWAKAFAVGFPEYKLLDGSPKKKDANAGNIDRKRMIKDLVALLYYAAGIQVTLVAMGFFQERIMTQGYARLDNPDVIDKFGDAQFLVFCNRFIALFLCVFVLFKSWSRQPPHIPPMYVHSYTSFSNTISSWCQYEALKYVSFPTQTICKASKVVATMLMGKVVRGTKYSWSEYGCGIFIAIGASIFLLSTASSSAEASHNQFTTFSGMILMIGYLVFDSFTLNWQKALFDTKPKVSKYQMMMGVNSFSVVLTAVSLLEQGTMFTSIGFALSHADFMKDVFFQSVSGAIGQLFIYGTIDRFGPIVFAVIMTIRQMISIVLSSIIYSHVMSFWALAGFFIVFLAIFMNTYRQYFEKQNSEKIKMQRINAEED